MADQLRALGAPHPARRVLPPEGRLSADEQPVERLRMVLGGLGPVFADFGRYLSSRVDLLRRRHRVELAEQEASQSGGSCQPAALPDAAAFVLARLGGSKGRRFQIFNPVPSRVTRWTLQYDAQIAAGVPVAVTVVRPDAERLLGTDLPLLTLVGPWFEVRGEALAEAIDDFSRSLRRRLDLTEQALAWARLAEDAKAGGGFEAPAVRLEYSADGVLTTERIGGVPIARATDREAVARQLASAWMRQAMSGHVVPFDFDSDDIRLCDGRLVLVGGSLERQTATERQHLRRYLAAAAADDPDAAWGWISGGATEGLEGQSEHRLRGLLRQAVPFRDGEWSGDERLAERVLVQWRTTRDAGWTMGAHYLHLYRGVEAISAATTRLMPEHDTLLDAFQAEQRRLAFVEARRGLDPNALPVALSSLMRDLVQLPQRLDDILTLAAEGRLRVKLHVPDAAEGRRVRNRTVSLVASLVALVGLAFVLRRVAPVYGMGVEQIGAILLMVLGGWLLVAAARL